MDDKNITNEEIQLRNKQYKMHKSFFDRAAAAICNGFYLEAIFLEYAAIEGRAEIILGVYGCPCNKEISDEDKRSMQISHRLTCIKKINSVSPYSDGCKLDNAYFKNLDKWRDERNRYIHGLYKNAAEYTARQEKAKELAEEGLEYAKKLYNEANRLKRILKKEAIDHIEIDGKLCYAKKCNMNPEKESHK